MVKTKTTQAHSGSEEGTAKKRSNGVILVIAALDMSWRLAIAILVPIIGGFELDKHLNSGPVLTIIGFIVAMAGMFLILRHTVASADQRFKPRENRR